MGRTSKAKNPAKKEERNRRMRKFNLSVVRPSKVEKDLRKDLDKHWTVNDKGTKILVDRRVGKGAAEIIASSLELLLGMLQDRCVEEAGPNHQITELHLARALADPKSGFHGIFPTRVAGVYLPVQRTSPKTRASTGKKAPKEGSE